MLASDTQAEAPIRTKDEVAEHLAQAHYDIDAGVQEIIRLLAPDDQEAQEAEPIKLLEVNTDTAPSAPDKVRPVYFGTHPASGMVYPSVVVEITPEEFRDSRILAELLQRYGWKTGPRLRSRPPRKP
jgi:hypothetical protein